MTDGAEIGITMQSDTGVFTNSTDTSYNDASKFFSDNSSYNIRKNASGQLELRSGYTVTWKNWNGTVLERDENVLTYTTPTYDSTTPKRASDSTNKLYISTLPNKLPTNSVVTVTATPAAGYEFVSMDVTDAQGNIVTLTNDTSSPTKY